MYESKEQIISAMDVLHTELNIPKESMMITGGAAAMLMGIRKTTEDLDIEILDEGTWLMLVAKSDGICRYEALGEMTGADYIHHPPTNADLHWRGRNINPFNKSATTDTAVETFYGCKGYHGAVTKFSEVFDGGEFWKKLAASVDVGDEIRRVQELDLPVVLKNESLRCVDPFTPGLSQDVQNAIIEECKVNPMYFMKMVCRPVDREIRIEDIVFKGSINHDWGGYIVQDPKALLAFRKALGRKKDQEEIEFLERAFEFFITTGLGHW